jgi:CTP:phosphocholine cytidylyltransferase-like protein
MDLKSRNFLLEFFERLADDESVTLVKNEGVNEYPSLGAFYLCFELLVENVVDEGV